MQEIGAISTKAYGIYDTYVVKCPFCSKYHTHLTLGEHDSHCVPPQRYKVVGKKENKIIDETRKHPGTEITDENLKTAWRVILVSPAACVDLKRENEVLKKDIKEKDWAIGFLKLVIQHLCK